MNIKNQHLVYRGQFVSAILLTPRKESFSLKFILILVGITLIAAGIYHQVESEPSLNDGPDLYSFKFFLLGGVSIFLAFIRRKSAVIQKQEIKIGFEIMGMTWWIQNIPLTGELGFKIEENESHEIMLMVDQRDGSEKTSIGPFDSREQAWHTYELFQFAETQVEEPEEHRIARIKEIIVNMTDRVSPLLQRIYQLVIITVGSVISIGLLHAIHWGGALAFMTALLIITEAWFISHHRILNVAEDYTQIRYTTRYRYFWVYHWSEGFEKHSSPQLLKKTLNPGIFVPLIIGTLAIGILTSR